MKTDTYYVFLAGRLIGGFTSPTLKRPYPGDFVRLHGQLYEIVTVDILWEGEITPKNLPLVVLRAVRAY